ncbi:methyltransferase domain-containing protein [Patescibacteria group bacterium]|nr:methyltransferase domain-containing protein [Patescibacteria group bacterium]
MEKGFYKNYFEIEKGHWLMMGRRAIVVDNLKKYLNKNPNDIKILDFGCGSGLFVEELAGIGYDPYGIDISSEAIAFGRSRGIKNIKTISSHKVEFDNNTFDAILALDVLEHLENEDWAIKEIERVLKPGGFFIIMVPAFMFLWGVQDEVSHHYRRYTRHQLLSKIEQVSSIQSVRSTYFNTFLFPPIALVRLMSRLFHIRSRESDFNMNSPFLNKLFSFIFNAERYVLKKINFPFGVSILVITRKEKDPVTEAVSL